MARAESDLLVVAEAVAIGYGGRFAAPPPPPPAVAALTLVAGATSATVGVAATGWRVDNTGDVPLPASVNVPAELSSSFTNGQTIAAGASVAFTLTALVSGARSVALSSSTAGVTITGSPATFTGVSSPTPPPPPPPPPPPGPGTTLTALTLNAPSAGTHPWACGHVFRQGDLAAGATLTGVQCSVLNTWPDGSARMTVLAGVTELAAGVDTSVSLTTGTAPAGSALTTSGLSSVVAVIGGSVSGSATFSGADWDTPFRTVVTGPLMSQWVFRKTIDATLHAYVEVRLWSNGAIEVLPWLENGYVLVAGTTARNETWTFTLGGTTRESFAADFPGRTRLYLITGTKLAHWLGTDPDVFVKHNGAYLTASRMVPNYPAISPDSAISAWAESITSPQEQGLYPNTIGSGGYHMSIGLLPRWDAMCVTNGSRKAYRVAQQQAYRAGRWGIYFRDETTLDVPRLSDHPTRVFKHAGIGDGGNSTTGSFAADQTGTAPASWKASHHPSMGFMAAVLTGRWCHIETAQFNAFMTTAHQQDNYRNGGQGAITAPSFIQARGVGWAMRSYAQALAITPPGAIATEFAAHLNNTANHNHARYVAVSRPHPCGFWDGGIPGSGDYNTGQSPSTHAPWMQDFITASLGYLCHLTAGGLAQSAKFTELFMHTAKSVVSRTSGGFGATDWPYRYAGLYGAAYARYDSTNWLTGNYTTHPDGIVRDSWPAHAGQMWDWTWGPGDTSTGDPLLDRAFVGAGGAGWGPGGSSVPLTREPGDGSLLFGLIGNEGSYWHNMMPALAYAVDFEVPGAADGYARIAAAPNFTSGIATFDANDPTWGVRPRSLLQWSTASSEPGSLVSNVWTPGRDAEGIVTQASVNLLPLNTMVKVAGTSMQVLRTMVEATGYNFATDNWSNAKDIRQTFAAWVGMATDGRRAAAYAGGGHANDCMNAIFSFDALKMRWEILDEPSDPFAPGLEWSLNYQCPPNDTYTNYTTVAGVAGVDPDGLYQDKMPDGRASSRHNYCGTIWDTKRNQIIESRISKWVFDVATGTQTRQRWTVNGGPPKALTINHVLYYHKATDSIWGLWSEADGGALTFGQCVLPGSNIVSRAGCPNLGVGRGTHCATRLDEDRVLYFWFSSATVERWGIHNMLTNTWEAGSGNAVTNPRTLGGFSFDHEMQPAVFMPTWGSAGQVIRRGTVSAQRGLWWLFDVATKTNDLTWTPAGAVMPTNVSYPGNKYLTFDALGIALFLDDVFDNLGSTANVGQTAWYVMRYR